MPVKTSIAHLLGHREGAGEYGLLRRGGILAGYGLLFLLLAGGLRFVEASAGVLAWSPMAGLNLALLVLFGPAYAPAVFVTALGSGWVDAGPGARPLALIFTALLTAASHAGAAAWLRARWRREDLPYVRPLGQFVVVAFALPAFIQALSLPVFNLVDAAQTTWAGALRAAVAAWMGDVVSLLSVAPFLFALIAPHLSRWRVSVLSETTRRKTAVWQERALLMGEISLLFVAFYFAFYQPTQGARLYFCLLPILWMALWHGLRRATLGIFLLNASMLFVLLDPSHAPPLLDLRLFMVILAVTGLLLGALISERTRGMHALREARTTLEAHVEERTAELRKTNEALQQEIAERMRAEAALQHHIEELHHSRQLVSQSAANLAALNARLARSEQQLRDLNTSKDTFFSIISHDLRSPFSVVLGVSELLAQETEQLSEEQVQTFARDIYAAARNTYELLENLLEWAQLQAGVFTYHPIRQNLYEAVEQNLELLQGNAAGKTIALHNDTDPSLLVTADRHMLHSILRNLISNAIKFTPAGGHVAVTTVARDGYAEVTVSDTGIGMSEEDLEKLFRIDTRLQSLGTEREAGSGLGLILSSEMVTANGGRIWAESEPGRGSRFHFTLPVASAPAS